MRNTSGELTLTRVGLSSVVRVARPAPPAAAGSFRGTAETMPTKQATKTRNFMARNNMSLGDKYDMDVMVTKVRARRSRKI